MDAIADEDVDVEISRGHRRGRRGRARRVAPGVAPPALGPASAVFMALWFGLVAGLLELGCELVRRGVMGPEGGIGRYQVHRDYLWMTPASSLLIFGACGPGLALVARFRPRWSYRLATLGLGFLAALVLLLTVRPLHPMASVLLAGGIASWVSPWLTAASPRLRRLMRASACPLLVLVAGLAVYSWGREVLRERQALARSPSAAPGAPNVLLIVLDAVRADELSLYGHWRDTTPALVRLARQGVCFENARATAPWTLPSHASMFTGRWPRELGTGGLKPLDATYPTLAEYLGGRGYATAGFAANYAFCTTVYGLGRGFHHYEERATSLADVLGCSGLGRQVYPVLDALRREVALRLHADAPVSRTDPKVVMYRRSAAEVNRAFLDWLRGREGRPFFAFLNYFDAHAPYLTPAGAKRHFGRRPGSRADYALLQRWGFDGPWNPLIAPGKVPLTPQEIVLARDAYDDCIAYIDDCLGRLFASLSHRGLLENTLVIITADHGEGFGEHGLFGHCNSLYRKETDVPLLIVFPPRAPQGRRVHEPASLRDLPATVVDLLGLSKGAPFPGRSLARFWSPGEPGRGAEDDPVYSELTEGGTFQALRAGTQSYLRAGDGSEQLYDLRVDPWEACDLSGTPGARADLERFRAALARVAPDRPPAPAP